VIETKPPFRKRLDTCKPKGGEAVDTGRPGTKLAPDEATVLHLRIANRLDIIPNGMISRPE
jgi:hypothetical protein